MSNNSDSGILLAYIARDGVVLAEARRPCHPEYSNYLTQAAAELQLRKVTPGWEFSRPSIKSWIDTPFRLKGAKFHIQDYMPADDDGDDENDDSFAPQHQQLQPQGGPCTWSIGCVYDANVMPKHNPMMAPKSVQSFIAHVERESKSFRQDDNLWKTGGYLSVQAQFAPTLLSILEGLDWYDQTYAIEQEIDRLKDIMQENITAILERGGRAEDMVEKAEELEAQAQIFKRRAKNLTRKMKRKHLMWQALYGTTATAVVGSAIAVPCLLLL